MEQFQSLVLLEIENMYKDTGNKVMNKHRSFPIGTIWKTGIPWWNGERKSLAAIMKTGIV